MISLISSMASMKMRVRWERKFQLARRQESRNDRVWDKFLLAGKEFGSQGFAEDDDEWRELNFQMMRDDASPGRREPMSRDRISLSLSLPTKLHLKKAKALCDDVCVGLPFLSFCTFEMYVREKRDSNLTFEGNAHLPHRMHLIFFLFSLIR